MLRVLFIPITGERGASSRYRLYQYLPFLERFSILPFVARIPSRGLVAKWVGLLRVLKLAPQVEVVFLQKRALDPRVLRLILALNDRLIYDFDDALYAPESPANPSWEIRSKTKRNLVAILRESKLVIGGNENLAAYARQHNSNVLVIPTALDTDRWRPREQTASEKLVLGWVGNSENLRYLQTLEGVFSRLASRYARRVVLRVVSGKPYSSHSPLRVDNRAWALHTELEDLQSFHIGLSPLTDDEWTRGKCGFRALQYMALATPVVASPVGVNRGIVSDGVNGFLAATEEEWFDKLSRLIEDQELRSRLGRGGRNTVEEGYSLSVNLPRLVAALREVAPL